MVKITIQEIHLSKDNKILYKNQYPEKPKSKKRQRTLKIL
jgi:hypothetical protein